MTSIALIGSGGFLFEPIVSALTTTFAAKVAFPIIVVTHTEGKQSTDHVKYVVADVQTTPTGTVVEHLKHAQVIVELLGPNPAAFAAVERIVAQAKPDLFIPSQFGIDIAAGDTVLPGFLSLKTAHSENTRAAGVKTVDVVTSLWAVPGVFLYEVIGAVGGDAENKTVTYLGDPDATFAVSKLADIGNTVAALATGGNYAALPDLVRIYSQKVSQRDVVAKYEHAHGVKLQEVGTKTSVQALEEGQKLIATVPVGPANFLYFLQVLISQGVGKGAAFAVDDRELVNPGQTVWLWSEF
jgi:hypothetical protein